MTYDPIPYARATGAPVIENGRRGALVGFGVGSILIGTVAGCSVFGLVMAVAMAVGFGGGKALPVPELIVALLMYASTATLFIWVGIDSIRCKRWVRPVVIAVGWITIVSAVFGLAFLLVAAKDLPVLMSSSGQMTMTTNTITTAGPGGTTVSTVAMTSGPMSGGDATMAFWSMLIFGLLGLLIAGAYVWFYSTAAVRRTLEAYSPAPSWSERCPLPVFVACAALLMGGLTTAGTAYEQAVPFFGTYVKGAGAIVLDLGAAGAMFAAMALMYRMKPLGWWLAVVVIGLGFASAAITLWTLGTMEFYRRGHATADDLDRLARSAVMSGVTPLIFVLAMGGMSVGYLTAVYRYFRGNGATAVRI
ncbi:MAG: hypothetical protein JWN40_1832 [Phycisphaerales bacterium]|nr:hypothetical protein [Phycisphaerales bacterium]